MSSKTVETDLDSGVLNNSEWQQWWSIGFAPFHQPKHIPLLDKYEEKILDGSKKSVFVPLCGKSHDMMWFYERGCTVCGVEVAEIPVREFFEEHKLEVEVSDVENVGKLYKSTDGRLRIYVADLFDMSSAVCGEFDMVYDCRSISAINKADRVQYANLLLSLLRKGGRYILCARDYDPTVYQGPPHSVSEKVVEDLYGEKCAIEKLHEEDQTNKDIHAHIKSEDTGAQTSDTDAQTPVTDAHTPVTDAHTPVTDAQTPVKRGDVGSILASSPYMYYRWFRMQLR